MSRSRFLLLCVFAAWLGAALNGCVPDQGQSDDEKEPHYVLGQSRVNAMDYQGAIEAFQESLEVDPHSAAAHYQLAMLYDTRVPDPAAAIYHYERYLKFEPDAPNAGIVRQRIEACKQQLAADVLALPSSSATQQQLEKLIEQNRQLQDEVDKWRAWYASQQAKTNSLPENNSAVAQQTSAASQPAQNQAEPQQTAVQTHSVGAPKPAAPQLHAHTVVAGETAVGIARRAGIRLNELQAANPGVNLSRIRVGQILQIP